MQNNLMAQKLTAVLGKDMATGGIKPVSEEEQRRINKFALRFQHKYGQPLEPVGNSLEPQPPAEIQEPQPAAIVVQDTVQVQVSVPEPEVIHNPFENHIEGIEGHLLDARNRILFTLEKARERELQMKAQIEKLEQDILAEQIQIDALQFQLKGIDDTVVGVKLFAEQALSIAPLLTVVHEHKVVIANDSTICSRSDVAAFFDSHRGVNWSTQEVIRHMPMKKQDNAKKNASAHLSVLNTAGFISRVGTGVYRKDE